MAKSVRAPSPPKPRWPFWLALTRLKLWEAVCLTFDVEPTAPLRRVLERNSWDESLPASVRTIAQRLDDCQRVVGPYGAIRPQGTPWVGMTKSMDCEVLLAEAVAFVLRLGHEVPPELSNLSEPGDAVRPSAPTQRAAQANAEHSAPVGAAELAAFRRCVQLISPLLHPHERRNVVANLQQHESGIYKGLIGFNLDHLGVLYFPSDPAAATRLVEKAKQDRAAGLLPVLDPRLASHATTGDLLAWAEGPRPADDSPLTFWLGRAPVQPAQVPQTDEPSPVAPGPANGATWPLHKPQRDDGLTGAVYQVLKAAWDAGRDKPRARDVLEEFNKSRPSAITKVLADGCDFMDSRGNVQSADLEHLRKRIDHMTRRLSAG